MRILIAEDDMVSRSFLSRFLDKYGECDLVVDGMEALDAFLIALKEKQPYDLICLDIMMPKLDGVKALRAIRDLEKQYKVAQEARVKIIMTTALAEAQLVRTAFEYGCEAYAAKPIDTGKFIDVLTKLGLIAASNEEESKAELPAPEQEIPDGYFRSVRALADYVLEVTMATGSTIRFAFGSRLGTARFGRLKDAEMFRSVTTDGEYLIFEKAGRMPVKITASEFMDLILIDRRK